MDKQTIKEVVIGALELTNQSRSAEMQVPITPETILFGQNGHLDSMALVALLLDIEDALLETGVEISISDEKAMSQANSPFKDIESLTDYVFSRLESEH